MSPRRLLPLALIVALAGFGVVRVAMVWSILPPTMATHFGPGGRPDTWSSRIGFLLVYCTTFGGVILLLGLGRVWMRRVPARLINLPHRDYWCTSERLPVAIDKLSVWMSWFSLGLAVFAIATLELVLRANMARAPLESTAMWALLGGFAGFMAIWLVGLWRTFRPPAVLR